MGIIVRERAGHGSRDEHVERHGVEGPDRIGRGLGDVRDPRHVAGDPLIGPSPNELRALATLGAGPLPVQDVVGRLEMTRQGAYKLLNRLRDAGYLVRGTHEEAHVYGIQQSPVVIERNVVVRPGRARLFVCMQVEPSRR